MNTLTELLNDVIAEQEVWITETYGDDAARTANYGWGVDEFEEIVSTKVYGHGILTTTFDGEHDFVPETR